MKPKYNSKEKHKSYYFQMAVKQFGKKKADLYWRRRYTTSAILLFGDLDCHQINKACDRFMARHKTTL